VFYLGECISRRHREISSALRVVRAGKQILCRFLQRFIWKVIVFPRRPRIEDQEVSNFDRIVFDVNAPAVPRSSDASHEISPLRCSPMGGRNASSGRQRHVVLLSQPMRFAANL
jgi:hypothetical protein